MITNLILLLIQAVVTPFVDLLPNLTLPSWLSGSMVLPTGTADTIGDYARSINGFVPVDLFLTVLGGLLALWPVIGAYVVFSWVWKHVPTIAGFGTGDG